MNLKKFTKYQLGLMKNDYEHFLYNEDYCKQALDILNREVEKEIEERQDVFEISLMNVFFLVFFMILVIANFAVSGTMLNYS